ncbi:MAG: hypothetical protein HQK96_14105 [Nitrospirae bacterium]|nr:hypothetical protein [Nitrospirota bacterium]
MKKTIEIEDASVVAFLTLKEIPTTPFIRNDGRVSFRVDRNSLQDALDEMHKNVTVRILDYISALKSTKNIIFNLKCMQ